MEQTETNQQFDEYSEPIPDGSVTFLWSIKTRESRESVNCPRCSGTKGQWRGYRFRKDGTRTRRRQCTICERWFARAQ